jgi:predicted GNAT family N-acyltransferase
LQNCGRDYTGEKASCKIAMVKTGRKIVPAKLQREKTGRKIVLAKLQREKQVVKSFPAKLQRQFYIVFSFLQNCNGFSRSFRAFHTMKRLSGRTFFREKSDL